MDANASMEIIVDSDTTVQNVEITLWSSASKKAEKVGKLETPPLEIRYIWNQEAGHRGRHPLKVQPRKKNN